MIGWVRAVRTIVVASALATCVSVGPSRSALITDHSFFVDSPNEVVNFVIEFDTAPDFFTIDAANRQADSFALFFDDDAAMTGSSPSSERNLAESIISASSIHLDGNLRALDQANQLLGVFPYALSGTTLSFQTSFDLLMTLDGQFTYKLLMVNFGKSAQPVLFGTTIPIPPALLLLLTGLIGLALIGRRKLRAS